MSFLRQGVRINFRCNILTGDDVDVETGVLREACVRKDEVCFGLGPSIFGPCESIASFTRSCRNLFVSLNLQCEVLSDKLCSLLY